MHAIQTLGRCIGGRFCLHSQIDSSTILDVNEQRESPFQSLGKRLKTIRQKLQETVADVSGAVEIDTQELERIEQGQDRPSEDILMLLISHFGIRDDEAASLWQLAGYEPPHDHDHDDSDETPAARATVLLMAVDPRVIYSDGVHVSAGPKGVVVSFAQGAGTSHSLTTARVGMSREQAYNVIRALQETLQNTEPRELPEHFEDSRPSDDPSDRQAS